MSPVLAQARLPCLGAQALTRVLHTMISAVCTISPSSSTTLHNTGKGWPSTLAWPFVDPVQVIYCASTLIILVLVLVVPSRINAMRSGERRKSVRHEEEMQQRRTIAWNTCRGPAADMPQ